MENLSQDVREIVSYNVFKKKIKPVCGPCQLWFKNLSRDNWRDREIVLSLLRSGKCNLNANFYSLGLIDSPLCDMCNVLETPRHFLIYCIKYEKERNYYLKHYIYRNYLSTYELLYGCHMFTDKENELLADKVASFVLATGKALY